MPKETIEVKLGDGSVVKGEGDTREAALEAALQSAVKQTEDTKTAFRSASEERDRAKQEVEQARRQAELAAQPKREPVAEGKFDRDKYFAMLNEDPLGAQNYLDSYRFGTPDPVGAISSTFARVDAFEQRMVAADFVQQHAAEYPVGDAKAARLLREKAQELVREGHPFNLRTLNLGWDELVASGEIKPLEQKKEEKQEQANPSLAGGGSMGEVDAELARIDKMSDKELEATMRQRGMM